MDSDRRGFLRTGGVAAVALLAGCGGASGESGVDALSVATRDVTYGKTDDGSLVVNLPVRNEGEDRLRATLVVHAKLDDERYEKRREVDVPAKGTETYEVTFEKLERDAFGSGGTVSFDFEAVSDD